MLNCKQEVETRVEWIKNLLKTTGAKGIVYGNSGGKDCTLVGILSKMATDNVTGIIMPCESSRNFGIDREHAILVGEKYDIPQIEIDLTPVKQAFRNVLSDSIGDCAMAYANINPRLRMTTLYAYAYKNNLLVAGTGNRSEAMMGYFTKWGDGAYDLNPIADLTENLAAEQKARVTYDNILRISDDPDVNDAIRFLREREVVHFQRFGEAMELLRQRLDEKNVYYMNPALNLVQ